MLRIDVLDFQVSKKGTDSRFSTVVILSFLCITPRGGGGTPIHYLYRYVPPNGVVILKLVI